MWRRSEIGNTLCPKCLTEVPWVSEYNTVETLITQKKQEEEKKACQERKKEQMQKRNSPEKTQAFFLCGFAVVPILGAILLGVGYYRVNSYAYQYQAGVKAYNQEDYDQAMDHMDRALSMEPDNPNANLMMAKIFDAQEDYASVEKILTVFLKEHPDNLEAYGVLLSAMERIRMWKQLGNCCRRVRIRMFWKSTPSIYVQICTQIFSPEPITKSP